MTLYHHFSLINESFARRDACAKVALILLYLGGLAIAAVETGLRVRDRSFLSWA
jgi:hypothetical protein